MNIVRDNIFNEIDNERESQDKQWGGPDHDDEHDVLDWIYFIERQMKQARLVVYNSYDPKQDEPDMNVYRKKLVNAAALAIAAIEAHDRKNKNVDD